MNLISWIFLILILGFSSYVIYNGWVRSKEGGCASCPVMTGKNGDKNCSHCG